MISNRAKDGFSNEKDFVKKLNSDKNHRYWKILNLNDNKDLFFVKVEGKKFCKTTKENILPKDIILIYPINPQIAAILAIVIAIETEKKSKKKKKPKPKPKHQRHHIPMIVIMLSTHNTYNTHFRIKHKHKKHATNITGRDHGRFLQTYSRSSRCISKTIPSTYNIHDK